MSKAFNLNDIEDDDCGYSDGGADRASDLMSKESSPIRHEAPASPPRTKPPEQEPVLFYPSRIVKVKAGEAKKNEEEMLMELASQPAPRHDDKTARKQYFQEKEKKSYFSVT